MIAPRPEWGGARGAGATGGPPLAGVSVLELGTFYAAPFGATLLTDLGARVIKIEQPGGENARRFPPMIGDDSAAFRLVREFLVGLVREAWVLGQHKELRHLRLQGLPAWSCPQPWQCF